MIQTETNLLTSAENALKETWQRFEDIKNHNQVKVLKAFQKAGIQNSHYSWVTGYGYDDLGKDKIDELFACYFNTEAALVRNQLVSGTHAITCAVLGNLNAGEQFVCVGQPYDTLQTVFNKISKKYNFDYQTIYDVSPDSVNADADLDSIIRSKVTPKTKLVFIQRSRGYEWRTSYNLEQVGLLIQAVKRISPEIICFVDNCYGEFTQTQEPTDVGADISAGSLIKNPGAGIVASGAYIVGRRDLVDNAAETLTAPGIGIHGGCMFDQTRLIMQGFFLAPMIVCEALKGMSLAGKLFSDQGLETIPAYDADRNDIIQAIKFNDKDKLIKFCSLVQSLCPVNSMFTPIPAGISGYDDEIIMASGSFVEGSSVELSVDAPLREPYIGYLQGGLSYAHTRYVINEIVAQMPSLRA